MSKFDKLYDICMLFVGTLLSTLFFLVIVVLYVLFLVALVVNSLWLFIPVAIVPGILAYIVVKDELTWKKGE